LDFAYVCDEFCLLEKGKLYKNGKLKEMRVCSKIAEKPKSERMSKIPSGRVGTDMEGEK
jgi:hypothetical protein